ncbi:MAG: hypothetical protein ACW981_08470 [Candidatus Hodarchaeales archaeon]|jgi:SAM-dependent methyltransferase
MPEDTRSENEKDQYSDIPLLPDQGFTDSSTALVSVSKIDGLSLEESEYYEYCIKLIDKHSIRDIESVLEIGTKKREFNELGSVLDRKYKVTRIILSQKTSAYTEDKETNMVSILGEDIQFPDIKDTFDCVILSQGVFSTLLQEKAISNFLNHLFDYLKPNGILIAEAYNIGGVYEDSCTKQGHRKWLQYRQVISTGKQALVSRLSVSHLDLENAILQINVRYIFETEEDSPQTSTSLEAFAIRTYSFPELSSYLRRSKFHRIFYYSPNSFDKIALRTFKFALVAEKL